VSSNHWLDSGGDPDHDVDTGIFVKEFSPSRDSGNSANFAVKSRKLWTSSCEIAY